MIQYASHRLKELLPGLLLMLRCRRLPFRLLPLQLPFPGLIQCIRLGLLVRPEQYDGVFGPTLMWVVPVVYLPVRLEPLTLAFLSLSRRQSSDHHLM